MTLQEIMAQIRARMRNPESEFGWYDKTGGDALVEAMHWRMREIGHVESFDGFTFYGWAFDVRSAPFDTAEEARRWVEGRCVELMQQRGRILEIRKRLFRKRRRWRARLEMVKAGFARLAFWRRN